MPHKRARPIALIALCAAAVLATACSDDQSGGATSASAPAPAGPAISGGKIGDGTFTVGVDVEAGIYTTLSPRDGRLPCSYALLPQIGADTKDRLAGLSFTHYAEMRLLDGDIVQTMNCDWILKPEAGK